jgi:hypothetical protein
MPRGAKVLEAIQTEGRKFLATIEAEIRERGKRGPGRPKGSVSAESGKATHRAPKPKPKRSSPAVDWDAVLAKLPKSFTGEDLAKATAALKGNSLARNIALARWSRAGRSRKISQALGAFMLNRWATDHVDRVEPAPELGEVGAPETHHSGFMVVAKSSRITASMSSDARLPGFEPLEIRLRSMALRVERIHGQSHHSHPPLADLGRVAVADRRAKSGTHQSA